VTVFSDTLEAGRQYLETGQNVVLTVEATMEAETLKLLARGVQPIDAVVADAGAAGLRVHVDAPEAIGRGRALLARHKDGPSRARGPVWFCVADHAHKGGNMISIPGRYLP
jgi:DNA polymerase III subunit alpha